MYRFGHPTSRTHASRVKKLGPCELDYLQRLVQQSPTIYLDELKELLERTYSINVSLSTICRALYVDLNLSRMRITKFNIHKSLILQRRYWGILHLMRAKSNQLVFVDETSKDIRDIARIYGRGYRGTRVFSPYPGRKDRFSVCAALSIHGFVGWGITSGTFDADGFISVMKNVVLPYMNAWPNDNSVIVLDGGSIHKHEEFLQACCAKGVVVVYLPPYSPEFNPIEETFQLIKAYIKRHQQEWLADARGALDTAFRNVLMNKDAIDRKFCDLYKHSGYVENGVTEWYQPIEQFFDIEEANISAP